ncbi:hypothetical protein [Motiliproteus sp.]|uniref:hypothetical protein n=1 Tax=Motiliproteus sp. TaxID=1898955 RepID=UPI003BA9B48B
MRNNSVKMLRFLNIIKITSIMLFVIILALSYIYFGAIYRYYLSYSLCSEKYGISIYEKVENNKGWLADDYFLALNAAFMSGVGYVRYKKESDFWDIKYKSGDKFKQSSYYTSLADINSMPVYKYKAETVYIDESKLIENHRIHIERISDKKILAEFNNYAIRLLDESSIFYIDLPYITCSGGYLNSYKELEKIFVTK